jgi:hypothetical protein
MGHSGYLSKPDVGLDPALFDGERLRPEVNNVIARNLEDWLEEISLNGEHRWLHLWITGSSISYQWNADRGPGDLDVMVGIEFQKFLADNDAFDGWSAADLSSWLNARMYSELWPNMAGTKFTGKPFEVTYYYNTTVADNINVIKPYAAYDLLDDKWVVKPPELPTNPGLLYDKSWYDAADRDTLGAKEIVFRYQSAMRDMEASAPGTPDWHNSGAKLHTSLAQAAEMYHGIHTGRKEAFSEQGTGYSDYHNFRYQRAKSSGALDALKRIADVGSAAHADEETALYGQPLDSAEVVLRRAAMMYKNQPS